MLVLANTTDNIQVVLTSNVTTNQARCVAAWRDITSGIIPTPGQTLVNSNNTTDVNVVPAPAASTERLCDYLSVYNLDTVPMQVTVKYDASGTEYLLRKTWLDVGETLIYTDGGGWEIVSLTGTSPLDVQSFEVAGTFTWTKPTSFVPTWVEVVVFGGGGGGGGGGAGTGAAVRTGGGGGGGGAQNTRLYRASDLGSQETVVVGAAGTAGAAGASGADGGDGGNGGTSSFLTGSNVLAAYGGGGGRRGTTTAAVSGGGGGGGRGSAGTLGSTAQVAGGGPGATTTSAAGGTGGAGSGTSGASSYAEYGGGGGAGHTNTPTGGTGGNSLYGGGGGGTGGGVTVTPALAAAGVGGVCLMAATTIPSTLPIGVSGPFPTAGAPGYPGTRRQAGGGGCGGGATLTANTNGAAGGAGGFPAGGGGGGGSGTNTGTGGAGGLGGGGAVYIYCW